LCILIDSEDFHPDRIMSVLRKKKEQNWCFKLGSGKERDSGLVKGIARDSGGRFDFVVHSEGLHGKIVSQPRSASIVQISDIYPDSKGCLKPFAVILALIHLLLPSSLNTMVLKPEGIRTVPLPLFPNPERARKRSASLQSHDRLRLGVDV
jgi:hypothetical protein